MATVGQQANDSQIDIGDHAVAWRWMVETARKNPEGFLRLTGGNIHRLKELHGAPHWTGDGKKWSCGWGVHMHGLDWVILAGDNQTIYRIRVPVDGETYLADRRVGTGITLALADILKQLTENPIA